MGCAAEVLSLAEVRASQARRVLRDDLHNRFDCWRDELEADLGLDHGIGHFRPSQSISACAHKRKYPISAFLSNS